MIKENIKSIDTSVQTSRYIGQFKGGLDGPTLIFIAGMHGNEPSGIFALRKVISELESKKWLYRGNLYAISGNLPALSKGVRYIKQDLNRLWTNENIKNIEGQENLNLSIESQELKDICHNIKSILNNEKGPFYFFDLHTTSSKTIPFITVNDSLLNRKYTSQYPVPIILGIEEYLEGALLSYINELGYIAFGFEGGQHDDPASVDNHISFINLSLVLSGSLKKHEIDFKKHYSHLFQNTGKFRAFYEIFKRYEIRPFEDFKVDAGYNNFQLVQKGQRIAQSNGKSILTSQQSRIFMPLYQGKGNDGFFMIRKVPKLFLNISTFLRKIKFDKILPILPGVKWASSKKDELVVDLKIARFFTKKFLHLLGYRSRHVGKTHLRVKNREAASRDSEYRSTL
ncbi:MAG: succinylglutamate desuccinylase/aspartoacylase family protein [Flavobacteriaceae bacterium]|nr:succinylglutamate desuccinylase/aspartoacylase family protein [Flavobacteriaceae bacterium]